MLEAQIYSNPHITHLTMFECFLRLIPQLYAY